MTAVQVVDSEAWSAEDTDLDSVVKALRHVRTAVRTDEEEGVGVPQEVTEAAALNLIASAADPGLLDEAGEVIVNLAQSHPSRSILFLRSKRGEDGLSAHVHAFCSFRPGSRRQVCCEQLRIEGRGGYADQLHSIVQPLLVPDVPVFVWWRGAPPLRTTMYDRLRELSQRMVVDSSGFREAFAALAEEVVKCTSKHCSISDLAWARLEIWREQIARLFDPPDTRIYLGQIESVSVTTTAPDYPTEAVLLLSWAGSRLGWESTRRVQSEGKGWTCSFRHGGRTIECAIEPSPTNTPVSLHEAITSVTIVAGEARLELMMAPGARSISQRVRLAGETMAEGSSGVIHPDLTTLLSREVELIENDEVYERAVALGAVVVGG